MPVQLQGEAEEGDGIQSARALVGAERWSDLASSKIPAS